MRENGINIGGEPSGHIILSDHTTTGDGFVAALQVLAVVKKSGLPVSQVCHRYEPLPQITQNVRYRSGKPHEHAKVRDAIAGGEERLNGHGRSDRARIRYGACDPRDRRGRRQVSGRGSRRRNRQRDFRCGGSAVVELRCNTLSCPARAWLPVNCKTVMLVSSLRGSERSLSQLARSYLPLMPAQAGIQTQLVISSHRSRHPEFVCSISCSFHARFHFLICRSRANALSRVSCSSYQTRFDFVFQCESGYGAGSMLPHDARYRRSCQCTACRFVCWENVNIKARSVFRNGLSEMLVVLTLDSRLRGSERSLSQWLVPLSAHARASASRLTNPFTVCRCRRA